ncbi:MAG: hypothetical protein ABI605_09460 [Rhizobacter sp.]
MRHLIFIFAAFGLVMSLASCGSMSTADPLEVQSFIEQRDACERFRAESAKPPNPGRSLEITAGLRDFCTGTDERLAQLKNRYADSPRIIVKLNRYEPHIEVRHK